MSENMRSQKVHSPTTPETERYVREAIDLSVATDAIVHVHERDYPRARMSDAQRAKWANDLHEELERLAEGYSTAAPYDGVEVIEYWGTRDGAEWRIHVRC